MIDEVVDWLMVGGMVVFLMEIVYGLGVDVINGKVVSCIFEFKFRFIFNFLIVYVGNMLMVYCLGYIFDVEE